MKKSEIILIDDDEVFIKLLLCQPEAEAYHIHAFTSPAKAIEFLKKKSIDLVISDIQMPQITGNEILTKMQDINPDIPLILVTAYGSTEKAIAAIKQGAYHYFEKSIEDKRDLFWKTVNEAILKRKSLSMIEVMQREKALQYHAPKSIIGNSDAMKDIINSAINIADTSVPVLLYGETGTGKDLLARVIHEMSDRRDRGFFPVNCHALSPNLLESELFGHEQGAFSGAMGMKKGLFEVAHKGTLFLDEIGNASLDLQAKLLRVIENREFMRVGGTSIIHSDFRIIAASNTLLEREVELGNFRMDLFYRLNIYSIDIPPLRGRREDIVPLVEYYLGQFCDKYRKSITGITDDALAVLSIYDWPGNVRELINIMERAVLTCESSMITTKHLPYHAKEGEALSGLKLEDAEKYCIRLALKQTNYNKSRAAEILGIHRKTLIEKVKKYNLEKNG